jgi:hypothetical protein
MAALRRCEIPPPSLDAVLDQLTGARVASSERQQAAIAAGGLCCAICGRRGSGIFRLAQSTKRTRGQCGTRRLGDRRGDRATEASVRLRIGTGLFLAGDLEGVGAAQRSDSAGDRLQKLEELLTPADPLPQDMSLFAGLLSIPTNGRYPLLQSPRQRKSQTFAALMRRLTKLASKQPVLILFEDAHWSDPTSIELSMQ